MHPFLISLLLISAGVVISPLFLPSIALFEIDGSSFWYDLSLSVGGAILGAFIGVRISLFYQRRDEFFALRDGIAGIVSLGNTSLPYEEWIEYRVYPAGGKQYKLTRRGSIALFVIREELSQAKGQLEKNGYSNLAKILLDALNTYERLSDAGLGYEQEIFEKGLEFRALVKDAKPDFKALLFWRPAMMLRIKTHINIDDWDSRVSRK
ncbi:hypothetical protein [Marinobacterium mangrovicola]|uniref:Uncharacterized protein n=1 Tax=Marinobacterium mangrovicola TaxID=1476959 RepID=A0A4R1GM74_9GAMM|nr:hypothetical protein [Marinobacterium mangrovicola]TCK08193.1 hypothetical protein CLV83_0267 [Marinobacterium mangrovicola]